MLSVFKLTNAFKLSSGASDWLIQRRTAVILGSYFLLLFALGSAYFFGVDNSAEFGLIIERFKSENKSNFFSECK